MGTRGSFVQLSQMRGGGPVLNCGQSVQGKIHGVGGDQAHGNPLEIELLGGVVHAVDMERALLAGDFSGIFPHLWWVLGYSAVLLLLAVLLFLRQMKRQ